MRWSGISVSSINRLLNRTPSAIRAAPTNNADLLPDTLLFIVRTVPCNSKLEIKNKGSDACYGKDKNGGADRLGSRAFLGPPAHPLPGGSHPTMRHADTKLPVMLGWPPPHLSLSNFENRSSLYEILQLIVTSN